MTVLDGVAAFLAGAVASAIFWGTATIVGCWLADRGLLPSQRKEER